MSPLPEDSDDVVSFDDVQAGADDSGPDLRHDDAPPDLTAEEAAYWRHFFAQLEAGIDPTLRWQESLRAQQNGGCCDGRSLD